MAGKDRAEHCGVGRTEKGGIPAREGAWGSGGAREREGGGGRQEMEAGEEEEDVERKHDGLLLRRPIGR